MESQRHREVRIVESGPRRLPTRFGIIGDVHAQHDLLQQALDEICSLDVDAIVCTGDIADGTGSLDRCCALLSAYDVDVVAGNHDRWLLEKIDSNGVNGVAAGRRITDRTLAYLRGLPATRLIETGTGRLMVCHGLGADDLFRFPTRTVDEQSAARLDAFAAEHDVRWLVNGHIHRELVRSWRGITFINAGTVCSRYKPAYGVLDVNSNQINFVDLVVK